MSHNEGVSRREFVATVGGAAVGAAVAGPASAGAQAKRRYAIVGTGVRGIGMWGRPIAAGLRGRRRVRRPLRHQSEARRGGEATDRRATARRSRTSTRCSTRPSPTC